MMTVNNESFSKVIAIWMILWSFCFLAPSTLAVESEIQIGRSASWVDRHAAEELQKYIQLLTNEPVKIVTSDELSKSQSLFLIGAVNSNTVIKRLADENHLDFNRIANNNDGFIIKSIKYQGRNIVIFSGNKDKGTMYAIYDYLENECGIGFFPDGEYIPILESMPIENIDRLEVSLFKYRYYLRWDRPVMKKYTTRWHTWEELKQVIDWEMKRKFNVRPSYSIEIEGTKMGGIIEKVFDLPEMPEELCAVIGDWWHMNWFMPMEFVLDRKEKALEYCRKLGFITDMWIPYGAVPRRYRQNHPEHIYVSKEALSLHPKDPAATRFTKEVFQRTIERFGTDHFYSMNPYGEHALGKDPLQLKIDAALNTARLLREIDASSELIWRLDGAWDFMINPGGIYNKETVKKFLDTMPDFLYVVDSTFNMLDETIYEKYDYFYGKKWALGLVHDLGADDQLHGDLADVLGKVQTVVNSPEGVNCIGFHMVPENANCSVMYWHCISKLAWNPKEWTVDKLIRDFCVHRYGKQSEENMFEYWKIITEDMLDLETWGGENFLNKPLYQIARRFGQGIVEAQFPERLRRAEKMVATSGKALQFALKEWDNQKDNILYENDLIDFLRTYLSKLSDFYFITAVKALENKNEIDYKQCRSKCIEILRLSAQLMSTRPDYSLSDTIRTVMKVPGANRYTEIGLKMSQHDQAYDTFDNYEQMIFDYIPMMEYLLDWYEGKYPHSPLAIGPHRDQNPVNIKRKWLLSPLDPPPEMRFDGTPRQAIRFVIDSLDQAAGKRKELISK